MYVFDSIISSNNCFTYSLGSHRVCSENTVFAMPETGIGLFPDVGGSLFLPRLPHPGLGMFLALSGHRLKGSDVLYCGVGTHYVCRANMEELTKELSTVNSSREVDGVIDHFKTPASSLPPFSLSPHLPAIKDIFDDAKSLSEIISKLTEHQKEDKFMNTAFKAISRFSPTSLHATFEQMKRGAVQSPKENFIMEYRMAQAFMDISGDFDEGIRALLIDKTNNPSWKPSTVDAVTKEYIDKFFAPHPHDLHL